MNMTLGLWTINRWIRWIGVRVVVVYDVEKSDSPLRIGLRFGGPMR